MSTLLLLRHGQSEWNAKNLFTGWVDVDLTELGVAEADHAGELLRDAALLPDVVIVHPQEPTAIFRHTQRAHARMRRR